MTKLGEPHHIPILDASDSESLYKRLCRAYSRDNPFYLLNWFNALLVGSFFTVIAVAGVGLFWIYSTAMLRNAEVNAVNVGRAILSAQVDNLLVEGPGGELKLAIAPEKLDQFDIHMRRFLRFFEMDRILIFDASRRVIYSTDPEQIGRSELDNDELESVLRQGKPFSEIAERSHYKSDGQARGNLLLVESYMPILDARGRSMGAFEVYVDISSTSAEIVKVVSLSLGMLAVVLAVCLVSLYGPMRRGTLKMISALRELSELATRDHLTGAYNRHYIAERIKQEFNRWRRHPASGPPYSGISFVMIDIDLFKRVNDTRGHAVGDEVLKEVAHRIGEGLREYDMLGRYGGEEFLVMLPNVDAETSIRVAERLRWSVGANEVRLGDGSSVKVTISLGLACTSDKNMSEHELVHCADIALYQAKAQGRDRVVMYR